MHKPQTRKPLLSKKNYIYREEIGQQETVVKIFTDFGRFQMEKDIGTLLQESDLLIPPRISVDEHNQKLVYTYIPAVPLVDIIETAEPEQAREMIAQVCAWMMKFYQIIREKMGRQYILGDVHLRNFILAEDSAQVYGVDFEECRPGRIETDVARLFVFILHYEPAFTTRKIALAEYVQKVFFASLELDRNFYLQEIDRELEEMRQRRRSRAADECSTGR